MIKPSHTWAHVHQHLPPLPSGTLCAADWSNDTVLRRSFGRKIVRRVRFMSYGLNENASLQGVNFLCAEPAISAATILTHV